MKRKQWMALALTLVMLFGMSACAMFNQPEAPQQDTTPTESVAPTADTEPTEAPQPTEPAPEEPTENVGAQVIGSLKTSVNEDNRADFDFTEKALEYLTYIGENLKNRNFGGVGADNKHDEAGHWIITELYRAGYISAQVEEQPFEGTNMYGDTVPGRNVVLTVPGLDDRYQIIVGAHYDGDGLGDNGSGMALLLATAAGLQPYTPQYTIKYIFFDAEENGMLGSSHYAQNMSSKEAAQTLYMINLDALAFGDFCNIYGGVFGDYASGDVSPLADDEIPSVTQTEGYEFAMATAEALGFATYGTAELDGYYAEHEMGMELDEGAFFTNPWTAEHPAPRNMLAPSPAALPASDQVGFTQRGIEYIYFEATNWWAAGIEEFFSYTGYVETYAYEVGNGGMFMNTEYDTLEQLQNNFPDRAEQHYRLYSPLLSALLLVEAD